MISKKVTVYIVNHNYENYLLQCYYSVLYQSYKNIELIIIDNNSSEPSKKLLNSISKINNTKVVYREKSDLISACNVAIKMATGEFIVRLDADDYLRKDAIELLVKASIKNNADLTYPEYFEVSKNGDLLNRVKHINFDTHVSLPSFPAHGACTLFRLSSLKDIGGYDEQFDRQDGYYMWINFLIKKYKIININEPLFFYRIHDTSLSSNLSSLYRVRSSISNKILKNSSLVVPIIDCFIPIIENEFDEKIFNKTLDELVKSNVFRNIIIWCSFKINIQQHRDKIKFIDRKYNAEFDLQNFSQSILEDLDFFYKDYPKPDFLFIRDLNTPNIKFHYFQQMRFLVSLFEHLDCIIATVETNDRYYKFLGDSLYPVRENDFVKHERQILYRKVRGFTLIRYSKLLKTKKIVSGVISPIPISKEDSIER
mgnify:CR=1 FL=1|tara:strand:+ start:6268 stop:7545 length:1278 start_codon:yes stop_codon:yes gene_type:complete